MSIVFQMLHVTEVFNFSRFCDGSNIFVAQFEGPVYFILWN